PIITTCGMANEYHQDAVMRSLSLVRRRLGSPLQYLVLGAGPMRGPLERLSVDLGLQDAVSFLGLVPHAGVADHLRRSHVYVSLVSAEGGAASLLDALACGGAPLASEIPAAPPWLAAGHHGSRVL